MDTKAAFAFLLIAIGIGGVYAIATGRLAIANGQITIGAPLAAGATNQPPSSTTQQDQAAPGSASFGTYNSTAPNAINSILAASAGSSTMLSQIYNSPLQYTPSTGTSAVSTSPSGIVYA